LDTITRDYLRVWRIISSVLLREYPDIFQEDSLSYEIETKQSDIPSLIMNWHFSKEEAKFFLRINAESNPRSSKNGTYCLMEEAFPEKVAQCIRDLLNKLAYSFKEKI
jgi:hypothetical protein